MPRTPPNDPGSKGRRIGPATLRNLDLLLVAAVLLGSFLALRGLAETQLRSLARPVSHGMIYLFIAALGAVVLGLLASTRSLVAGLDGRQLRWAAGGLLGTLALALVMRFWAGEPFTPRYHLSLYLFPWEVLYRLDLVELTRAPGLPLLVALAHPTAEGVTLFDAFTANALLGALTVLPVFGLGWRLSGRLWVGLAAAALLALDPLHVFLSRGLEFMVGGLFFATTAFALLLRRNGAERRRSALLASSLAALFLATTFRNEFLLLGIPYLVVLWAGPRRTWGEWIALAVFAAAFAASIAFQVLRFRLYGEWQSVVRDPAYPITPLAWLVTSGARLDLGGLLGTFSVLWRDPVALTPLAALLPALFLDRERRRTAWALAVFLGFLVALYTAARPGGIGRTDGAYPAIHLTLLVLWALTLVPLLEPRPDGRRCRLRLAWLGAALLGTLPVALFAYRSTSLPARGETAASCRSEASCRYYESRWARRVLASLDRECQVLVNDGSLLRAYGRLPFGAVRTLRDHVIYKTLPPGRCVCIFRDYHHPKVDRYERRAPVPFSRVTALVEGLGHRLAPRATTTIGGRTVGLYCVTPVRDTASTPPR